MNAYDCHALRGTPFLVRLIGFGLFKPKYSMLANINQKDLLFMIELMNAGKVKSVIDKRYPLNEAAEAIRYLEDGHALGKVVITV